MGSLYRSERMALCQLFLQIDSAFESVAELGELGICQFRDLNSSVSSFQRKFVLEVKRCCELERKIRFVEVELEEHKIPIPELKEISPAPLPKDLNELETNLERLEDEIIKMNASMDAFRNDYNKISDIRHVMLQLQVLLQENQRTHAFQSISEAESGFGPIELHAANTGLQAVAPVLEKPHAESIMPIIPRANELKFLAGIVATDRVLTFERVLWRMCHGKVFLRTQHIEPDLESPFTEEHKKSAFILFFSGEVLSAKVRRICESFRAGIVENCPEGNRERAELLNNVTLRLLDLNTVIGKTLEHQNRMLVGAAVKIKEWEIQVVKMTAIYHILNMFNLDVTQKCLIAECWVPQEEMANVRKALQAATEFTGSNVASIVNRLHADELGDSNYGLPPTFHRLNKFTRAFQGIVDAYGVANYREINPAPWTIITFPFLFAVMFGDTGHGLIMLLAALGFVLFERRIEAAKIRDEIFNTFYGGRYVILLMGIFAIYTGLIYNDIFSKSLNIFGSRWRNTFNESELLAFMEREKTTGTPISMFLWPDKAFMHDSGPYVFGLDPVWSLAENRLNFVNPMKMKASVIMGISQMLFGVLLSVLNYIHFDSKLDFFFVFIPQLLFLTLIFVYLCVQIILKWIFFWVIPNQTILDQFYPNQMCAPSLLVGLINMFMFKSRHQGFVYTDVHDGVQKTYEQCHLQFWYPNQGLIESSLMIVAVLCIPVMLFVKPLVLLFRVKVKREQVHMHGHGGGGGGGDDAAEFNFGDVFVYQAIHTIEFALGCISHTASYLRLWALSLAHAQLSDVLWTMVMRQSLVLGGWAGAIGNFVIFWFFSILSVAILVLMEGLSAFLHALRLHWVEFQSKFYGGTGIAFEPFSFEKIIRKHEGLEDE